MQLRQATPPALRHRKTVKRHVALHPLSQHHHFALMAALFIRRALKAPAAGRKKTLERVVRKFLRFWKKAGQQHFREEEEVLLPAWSKHGRLDKEPLIMRLVADHAGNNISSSSRKCC